MVSHTEAYVASVLGIVFGGMVGDVEGERCPEVAVQTSLLAVKTYQIDSYQTLEIDAA